MLWGSFAYVNRRREKKEVTLHLSVSGFILDVGCHCSCHPVRATLMMKPQLKRYSMLELIKFQYLTSAVGILRDEKRCHCTGHNPKPYNGCLLYNCSDKGKEGIGRKLTPDMPVLCHYTHGVSLCLCCVIMSMQTKVFVL